MPSAIQRELEKLRTVDRIVMSDDMQAAMAALHLRAEAILKERQELVPDASTDAKRLLHELQVHHIELELQNEELIARRDEVEEGLKRYTDLYEFAPVAYVSLTADGTLKQTNAAGERLLGNPRAALEGKRLVLLVVEDDRRALESWLEHLFMGGEPPPCELRLPAAGPPDGAVLTVQIDAKLSASGRHCCAVLIDVTERLASEKALKALEFQLYESQKMEAIGTLAGGIAHDFNNILAAILGNVVLAQQDVGEEHAASVSLAQIRQASVRARSLVQQILTFSRRSSASAALVDLKKSIHETLALLGATLPASVQLRVSLCEERLTVLGDETGVQQVVMNLCTNAWQALYTEGGYIELQLDAPLPAVSLESQVPFGLAAGRHARLRVRDNGCGMDVGTQARVFEPFFTTKAMGRSTGLGLSVVHGIVTSMGGLLRLHSNPRQGSSFEVWLPLAETTTTDSVVPS